VIRDIQIFRSEGFKIKGETKNFGKREEEKKNKKGNWQKPKK